MLRVGRGKGGVDREVPLNRKLLETLQASNLGCYWDLIQQQRRTCSTNTRLTRPGGVLS